jgi:drug/metabolite transporter (DMT)-like permease
MTASPLAPVATAILGIGVLTVMDGIVKFVSAEHATAQVVALRYAFGTVAATIAFTLARAPWPRTAALRAHALRAVVIAVTAFTFFYAVAVLPLAVALALSFIAPIFIALAAQIHLGEQVDRSVWIAVALGFCGVLVVLSGEIARSGEATLLGIAAAMLSPVSYALSMVMLKTRTRHDPVVTIVLLQNALPMVLLAPLGALAWTAPSGSTLVWFVAIGVLGTAGHLALAWAYGRADASRLGVMEYTAFVWGVLIGLVVFAEVPSGATIVGTAFIVAGAVLVARRTEKPDVEIGQ